MDENKKSYREVIVYTRLHKGITQAQMGEALGVSQSYQAYIENGSRYPNSNYLVTFLNVYGINLLNYDMAPITEKEKSTKVSKSRVR